MVCAMAVCAIHLSKNDIHELSFIKHIIQLISYFVISCAHTIASSFGFPLAELKTDIKYSTNTMVLLKHNTI